MQTIPLALGRVFSADAEGVRVADRPPRWGGLVGGLLVVGGGYYGFLHGVLHEAWYALPALLGVALGFFVAVRLVADALRQQTLICTPRDVVLRRFRFGHEVAPQRLAVRELARVERGRVAYTRYGPIHGLCFTDRNGARLTSLRAMPAREMQGLLHRLEALGYPVAFDAATPLDVQLGDTPVTGLWRWP